MRVLTLDDGANLDFDSFKNYDGAGSCKEIRLRGDARGRLGDKIRKWAESGKLS